MLRCVQRSSLEKFASGIGTDMSVLERQRFMLQRLYQQYQQQEQQNLHSSQTTMPLFQYQNLMNSLKLNHSVEENSLKFGFACSKITTNTSLDMDHHQCPFSAISANSSKDHQIAPTKKRKAEFDVEEDCKEKRLEGEAGEVQSGITVKSEKENSGGRNSRENSKVSEVVQKTDYIHVRARRGQATDSHSLAERARREKISKKMKCLQDLVPGCNKVTGKAGMLDEIINYVQSLQKQVEFLSMKLAALNPRLDFNIDNFFAQEFPAYIASFPTAGSPKEVVHSALVQYNQGQQESTCSGVDTAINPNQMVPQRTGTTSSVSFPEAFLDSVPSLSHNQQMSTWDSGWQSLYNVSFH